MKRQLMAEQWDQFARAVLPANASTVQMNDLEREFSEFADAVKAGRA